MPEDAPLKPMPSGATKTVATELAASVSAVIVHYGDPSVTSACIRSILSGSLRPGLIYVVDNDPSPLFVESHLYSTGVPIRTLRPATNIGFAGGVNAGANEAFLDGARYCWVLNNDAQVSTTCLLSLLLLAIQQPNYAVYGTYIASSQDSLWYAGGDFEWQNGRAAHRGFGEPWPTHASNSQQWHPTDWISGCNLFFSAVEFESRGPMDAHLFLYKEDLDWQLRNWRPKQAAVVAWPHVLHAAGQATGTSDSPLGQAFMARNQRILAARHAGAHKVRWHLALVTDLMLRPLGRLRLRAVLSALIGYASADAAPASVLRRLRHVDTAGAANTKPSRNGAPKRPPIT